jgi:hypothetical protein
MPINDIRTQWLSPNQLIFLSNCTIQVTDIKINHATFAYKLDKPAGVNCIISHSFIDWQDNSLSTFYAVDRLIFN